MIGLGNYVLSGGEDPDDPPPAIFGRARSLGMRLNWKRSGNYVAMPARAPLGETTSLLPPIAWLAVIVIGAIWIFAPKSDRGHIRSNPFRRRR